MTLADSDRRARIIQTLIEIQKILKKFERRPESDRTENDRNLIEFYKLHIVKLTSMMETKS